MAAVTKICSNPQGLCPMAGIEQPVENFHTRRASADKLSAACKECIRIRKNRKNRYRPKGEASLRDPKGRKRCTRCGDWLAEFLFSVNNQAPDSLHQWCKRCQADRSKSLSPERRKEMLTEQGGKCAGPGCNFAFDVYGGPSMTYHIDHNHECCPGQVTCGECTRALLCPSCNSRAGTVGLHLAWMAYCLEYEKSAPAEAEAPIP